MISHQGPTPLTEIPLAGKRFRPCTPNMLPVVGELPGSKNIYLATGHCRLGVTLAPVTAELILSRLQGARSELPVDVVEIVSPRRFIG